MDSLITDKDLQCALENLLVSEVVSHTMHRSICTQLTWISWQHVPVSLVFRVWHCGHHGQTEEAPHPHALSNLPCHYPLIQ